MGVNRAVSFDVDQGCRPANAYEQRDKVRTEKLGGLDRGRMDTRHKVCGNSVRKTMRFEMKQREESKPGQKQEVVVLLTGAGGVGRKCHSLREGAGYYSIREGVDSREPEPSTERAMQEGRGGKEWGRSTRAKKFRKPTKSKKPKDHNRGLKNTSKN